MLFLSYFIPLIYGYFFEPIIFPKYIIFVLIPIILIISILVFYIEKKILRNILIFILILFNLGNHFTESTFKQFFYERVKFKPDFDTALEIIKNSETKKMILYKETNNQNKNFSAPLFNYMRVLLNNKNYEIDLLSNDLESHKGKIWNICYDECYKPPFGFKILSEKFLNGGLRLSFWEKK